MHKTVWLYKRPHYASDLEEAFHRLGWHTEQMDERTMMRRMLTGEKPTLVISNVAGTSLAQPLDPNMLTVNSVTLEKKIPLVWLMWDSPYHDPSLLTVEQQRGAVKLGLPVIYPMVFPYQENLHVFTVSRESVPYLKGKHVEYMPFGVNERRFKPMNLHQPYPTAFVGTSLLGDPLNALPLLDSKGLLSGMVNMEDGPTANTWRILADVGFSAMDRVQACEAVGAHVWGDGWGDIQNIHHHGNADWEKDLPTVLNSCGVSLNVSKRCFPNDVAPRLLEILACGGICISNRLPGIAAEFGDAVWFYDSIPELQEMVAKLLVYGKVDSKKKDAGRKIVEAGWTWEHRARRIIDVVFG